MRRFLTPSGVALLLSWALPASMLADTWCSATDPNAVFCDDFDRYCVNPPPEPQACPSGSSMDGDLFHARWIPTGPCSSAIGLDSLYTASLPWAAKTNTQENSTLGLAKRSFTTSIRAKYGEAYSSVVGTDLNPLVLELVMQASRPRFDNTYLSFGAGFAVAPADYAWSNFCGCSSPDPRYPIICAQDSPPAGCPPESTWPHVPCIAVGFVSHLDSDPCECSGAQHSPINEHLSFYDGFKWYKLRQGLFPNGSGGFFLRAKQNRIRITIKLTTLKVELTTPETGEYSWCELPRDYLGTFSSFMVGYAVPCQLKTGTWECRGDSYDPLCGKGTPGGSVPYYDNIAVHGGIPYADPGACCFPNTSCISGVLGGDCTTMGGTFAGPNTTCDTVACCPPLKPDHDMDADVDVSDFGWFQTCLSSGPYLPPPTLACECAELDGDGDVDVEDLEKFYGCLTAPGVPASGNCLP